MLRLLVAVWGGVGAPCRGGTIHRVPHRGAPHTFFVRFTRDECTDERLDRAPQPLISYIDRAAPADAQAPFR
jgi:hypothetical protein